MVSVSQRRPAKIGGEILTAKPRFEFLSGKKVSLAVIGKNEKLIEKHLNKSKNVSMFQNDGIDKANDGNLEIVKEEPSSQFYKNRARRLSRDKV